MKSLHQGCAASFNWNSESLTFLRIACPTRTWTRGGTVRTQPWKHRRPRTRSRSRIRTQAGTIRTQPWNSSRRVMFRVSGWLRSSLLSGFFGCEMGLRASLLWGLSRLGFTLGFLWACLVGGSLGLRVSLRWRFFSLGFALHFYRVSLACGRDGLHFFRVSGWTSRAVFSLYITCLYLVFAFGNFRFFCGSAGGFRVSLNLA